MSSFKGTWLFVVLKGNLNENPFGSLFALKGDVLWAVLCSKEPPQKNVGTEARLGDPFFYGTSSMHRIREVRSG